MLPGLVGLCSTQPFNRSGVLVGQAGNQTIANPESVATWDQETFDPLGAHDNVTANSRLVSRSALARVVANFALSAADCQPRITKNGSGTYLGRATSGTNGVQCNVCSPILELDNPGTDYFEVVINAAGAGRNTVAASGANWFGMESVDPTLKRCLLQKSVDQAITSIESAITFDATPVYNRGFTFSGAAPSKIIILEAGYYRIGCNLNGSSVAGQLQATIRVTTAFPRGSAIHDCDTTDMEFVNAWSAPILLAAGDEIEVYGQSTNNRNVVGSVASWLAVEEVPAYHKKAVIYKSVNQAYTGGAASAQVTLGGTVHDADGMKSGNNLIVPAACTEARASFGIVTPSIAGIMSAFVRRNSVVERGCATIQSDTAGVDCLSGIGAWVPVTAGDSFGLWFSCGTSLTLADHNGLWFALECR